MHLLIPFAYCSSEGCAASLPSLKLPNLQKLLSRLTALPPDQGELSSLSLPHERALARAIGLPVTDGLIPWAALEARQSARASGAWSFITPCHWEIGSKQVVMSSLALPEFSAQDSQTLLAAMQAYFAEDGITLHYFEPTRWLAHSEMFNSLATASADRVSGRHVANWLPSASNAAVVLRLQGEMQMLLYDHPLNEARSALGLPTVNSFWLSGTGALPPAYATATESVPTVVATLRDAALQEDWPAWAAAWEALDANECAAMTRVLDQGSPVRLTFCGERHAQTFQNAQTPFSDSSLCARSSGPKPLTHLEPDSVTASAARQSMHSGVMDRRASLAMTNGLVHRKERSDAASAMSRISIFKRSLLNRFKGPPPSSVLEKL